MSDNELNMDVDDYDLEDLFREGDSDVEEGPAPASVGRLLPSRHPLAQLSSYFHLIVKALPVGMAKSIQSAQLIVFPIGNCHRDEKLFVNF